MPAMKRFKIIGIIFGVALFIYTLFGFFALPGIIKNKLAETISEYTGCPVSIGELSVNPLVLSTTIRDFSLKDKRGEPLIAFKELYINFESTSLFRGGYAFSEISLKSPSIRLLTRADGSVNFQDMIPPDDNKKDTTTAKKNEPPTVVMIDHLQISRGEIVYEDRKRQTPFVGRLDSLNLSLRDFATRPEDKGVYQFQALTDKGEGLKWRGTISVMPLRSAGNLALTGFKARTFWEYVQDMFVFEVTDGLVDLQADYELDLSGEKSVFNIRNGSASAKSVKIIDRRDSSEAVFVSSASIKGLESEINKKRVRIGEIRGDAGKLFVAYQPDNTISLKTLFLPKPDPKAPPDTAAPWVITVSKIALENYSIVAEDRTIEPVAHLEFASVGMTIENYIYGIPNKVAKLTVAGRMKEGGSLALSGDYVPEPLSGAMTIKVDSLDLRPFQTYVSNFGKIDLKSGTLSVEGSTRFKSQGEELKKDFKGDVWLEDFRLVDRNLEQDFLRWARLDLRRIAYNDQPSSISIGE
ncbi:MAG: DUF748 domain-containing protein, partial [Chlorobiales bacterium]|nr:DUF748 domain-containing protein [Chlorobiales bacterium]